MLYFKNKNENYEEITALSYEELADFIKEYKLETLLESSMLWNIYKYEGFNKATTEYAINLGKEIWLKLDGNASVHSVIDSIFTILNKGYTMEEFIKLDKWQQIDLVCEHMAN